MSRRFIFLLFSLLSLEWKHVCITILIIICQCIQFTWRGHPEEQKTQGASHKGHSVVVYVTIASSPSAHRRLLFSFASVSRMTGTLGILYMINYVIGTPPPPPPPTNWPNLYLFLAFHIRFFPPVLHNKTLLSCFSPWTLHCLPLKPQLRPPQPRPQLLALCRQLGMWVPSDAVHPLGEPVVGVVLVRVWMRWAAAEETT